MDIYRNLPTIKFCGMLLKRGTGSEERGTGNGSLGTSCQRTPPQKSKMAVQTTRERKKLATTDSASPKPKMNWKLIKTLERGWYQVLLTPAYDERLYFFEVNIPTKNAWSSGSRKDFNNVKQSLKCPHFLIDACVSHG